MCKHCRAKLDTPAITNDPTQWHAVLRDAVIFLVLAAHDNEQADLVARMTEVQ